MPRGLGTVQKKILIFLLGHLSAALAHSSKQRYWTLRHMDRELEKIDANALRQAINSLYKNRLIDLKENLDGSTKMILLDAGKNKILNYKIDDIKIPEPKQWDKKWRLVLFDIPKNRKKAREAIRFHLKRLGFYPYQKSIFIYPYECQNEIDFIIEFYGIRPYVRQMLVERIDNELHLKEIFKNYL